jgi:hypothetical protein
VVVRWAEKESWVCDWFEMGGRVDGTVIFSYFLCFFYGLDTGLDRLDEMEH